MVELQEICSNGGPILVVPAELASAWYGTETDDYDRACNPRDHTNLEYGAIGAVLIEGMSVIVLDFELITSFIPTADGGVILRNYEDSPFNIEATEAFISATNDWTDWGEPLNLQDGRLFLFDSAFSGAQDPNYIEADEGVIVASLGAGRYTVSFAVTEGVELIRLTRLS